MAEASAVSSQTDNRNGLKQDGPGPSSGNKTCTDNNPRKGNAKSAEGKVNPKCGHDTPDDCRALQDEGQSAIVGGARRKTTSYANRNNQSTDRGGKSKNYRGNGQGRGERERTNNPSGVTPARTPPKRAVEVPSCKTQKKSEDRKDNPPHHGVQKSSKEEQRYIIRGSTFHFDNA